jgi:hypothetical protein
MAEIYVNTISKVGMRTFYAGNIIDALIPITASIYDITEDKTISPAISPTTPLYAGIIAEKTETDPGSYEIIIPYAITDRPRKLKVTWQYLFGSQAITQYTFVDVVTPYAPLSEIVEDLGISTDPSDPNYKSYHELVMAEKYARKVIENYTGQNFYLYDDTQIAYGNGSDLLPLPFKLNTLHELYEDNILLIDNIEGVKNWIFEPETSETGFGLKVDRTQSLDNIVYMANGLVPPSINDRSFGAFKKDARYTVTGKFGWDDVPDNVEQACIQLVGDYFAKDKTWTNRYVKKISTFDWDFEYSSETYRGTGNAYADQLLYPYVLSNMVVI